MADLAEEILLPDAVADELLAGPVNDSARLAVAGGWGAAFLCEAVPFHAS
jgi:hypothetical protein